MSWARQIHLKSQAELQTMREAGRINAEVLATVRALLKPGVSTADLNAAAEDVLRKHKCVSPFKGYGHPPFPTSITVSVNRELVHGIPSKKRILKEGDIVSIDCGTVLNGLVADSALTAGVGEISPEARNLLKVTEEALALGIEKMRVGNRTGDVSAAIQKHVESNGYFVTREYTGHGVGRQMHEGPQLPNYGKAGTGLPLKPGMTIAIEPMVLIGTEQTRILPDHWTVVSADGSLTAHFEHSVAVTEGDPLILTVP
ncbi:MAG TPA: type I methionyl aminopeptidase [Anaerolineales bacterium]|nr:type I methionyl aminopeptidase [Anaerolineales bacterium]HMR98603.1 type I methionyl aminopeptidase [Anaerolineales bacterium]HNQ94903.1 type I methionyl aminopeptidase [Anaerolineales bacterium]HNS61371.1 type I methionyl aminopeptidase [Anaerolineales bacterium]